MTPNIDNDAPTRLKALSETEEARWAKDKTNDEELSCAKLFGRRERSKRANSTTERENRNPRRSGPSTDEAKSTCATPRKDKKDAIPEWSMIDSTAPG